MPWAGHQLVIFGSSLAASGFTSARALLDRGVGDRLIEVGDEPGALYPVQLLLV